MRSVSLFAALFLLLISGGCAGYQLGSMLPPDVQTCYVHIADNLTDEPLLENEVTQAFLSQLQRDGSLEIVEESQADAIIRMSLESFDVQSVTFESSNRSQPAEYRLTIRGRVEMTRASDGAALVRSGLLEGRSTVPLNGDLVNAKRLGTPDAAEDLARRFAAAVWETWTE